MRSASVPKCGMLSSCQEGVHATTPRRLCALQEAEQLHVHSDDDDDGAACRAHGAWCMVQGREGNGSGVPGFKKQGSGSWFMVQGPGSGFRVLAQGSGPRLRVQGPVSGLRALADQATKLYLSTNDHRLVCLDRQPTGSVVGALPRADASELSWAHVFCWPRPPEVRRGGGGLDLGCAACSVREGREAVGGWMHAHTCQCGLGPL